MAPEATTLLGPNDPPPFAIDNAEGSSAFLLIGDHAGTAVPAALGDLGITAADRARHIFVDIGVRGLGRQLACLLDAPFIHQTYSRLVIDCNRDPAHPDAIVARSDGTFIPGNDALKDAVKQARVAAVHTPYHAAIAGILDARQAAGRDTVLISLHSFTPILNDFQRPWEIGVLHWLGRTDFARTMLSRLQSEKTRCVGDNEPYRMDSTDYTIALHAFARNLRYAEIEIRQDLIKDYDGQNFWTKEIQKAAISAWRTIA
ncbi:MULTISPECIES: N-formylglutamate amidohydrolase [Sphingobium]|uniref:N-formylglutamate amidohydrolase n=1 Tax=Sphingobium TaxID=165695 RepID=UPI001BE9D660|nr:MULTISPECIES: N-formylglutamate amidohydrolase [Sphingobium]MBT2246344.1 N-formylglutamate amidohydrolase [Sphingobium sp. BHU LFT2]WBQ19253.1 N-formylglutamate amidohydrolase [Sphingobium yanoikuyae]